MRKSIGFQGKFSRYPEFAHGMSFNDFLVAKLEIGAVKTPFILERIRQDALYYIMNFGADNDADQKRVKSLDKTRDAIEYLWRLHDFYVLYSNSGHTKRFEEMQNGIERLVDGIILEVDRLFPESKRGLQEYSAELKEA